MPMLATAGRPPVDAGLWAVEMKWDGMRAVTVLSGGRCRFISRNGRDVTGSFPELAAEVAELVGTRELIADGEIVAPDPGKEGAPSFARLQQRMHVVSPDAGLIRATPVQLFVFDLLEFGGESVMKRGYLERRQRLHELALVASAVQTPPHWTGVEPAAVLEIARDHRLEGIVSKRVDSSYEPGRRSPLWIKTPIRNTTEAIVAGWNPGGGRFTGSFGSLILGAYDSAGRLVHIGNVGTGFTAATRKTLLPGLAEIARTTSPFDIPPPRATTLGAHWVEPVLVADIEYRELATDGLRHPSWRGLRTDKSPTEIKVPK